MHPQVRERHAVPVEPVLGRERAKQDALLQHHAARQKVSVARASTAW
ncbi:hypothetical protein OG418_00665 [Streptomyces phaeochromogenes]